MAADLWHISVSLADTSMEDFRPFNDLPLSLPPSAQDGNYVSSLYAQYIFVSASFMVIFGPELKV